MVRKLEFGCLALFAICTLTSCSDAEEVSDTKARIATWNLEWFGALGRNDSDISQIAKIITESGIDILALQEITCPCALEKLAAELKGYDYFISPQRIPQKLALLWKKERVKEISFDKQAYTALRGVADHGLERESRQPLVFRICIDEFDFTLVVVHLKSVPENEWSTQVRNAQYDVLNNWLHHELNQPDAERDVIIAGDFNAYTKGVSSERLLATGLVEFATADLPGGEYSNIWFDHTGSRNLSLIDHIAITFSLRQEEFSRILSIRDLDAEFEVENYLHRISDHLPVIAEFETSKDMD